MKRVRPPLCAVRATVRRNVCMRAGTRGEHVCIYVHTHIYTCIVTHLSSTPCIINRIPSHCIMNRYAPRCVCRFIAECIAEYPLDASCKKQHLQILQCPRHAQNFFVCSIDMHPAPLHFHIHVLSRRCSLVCCTRSHLRPHPCAVHARFSQRRFLNGACLTAPRY